MNTLLIQFKNLSGTLSFHAFLGEFLCTHR